MAEFVAEVDDAADLYGSPTVWQRPASRRYSGDQQHLLPAEGEEGQQGTEEDLLPVGVLRDRSLREEEGLLP